MPFGFGFKSVRKKNIPYLYEKNFSFPIQKNLRFYFEDLYDYSFTLLYKNTQSCGMQFEYF